MRSAWRRIPPEKRYQVNDSGCWIWLGAPDREGYGRYLTKANGQRAAHRFMYEIHRGPIPDGLVLDHLCRVRLCVNPDHLEPVTDRENILRGVGVSAANAAKTECGNGHPFDVANTYFDGLGKRHCRACNREAVARYQARRRAS